MPAHADRHDYIALSSSPDNDDVEAEGDDVRHGRRVRRDGGCIALPRTAITRWVIVTLCVVAVVAVAISHRLIIHALRHQHEPSPNPYFTTGDPSTHNARTLNQLARCRSLNLLRNTATPHLEPLSPDEESRRHALGCGTNQTTLIILSSLWFSEALIGSTTGEAIYAQSAISTLNYWGYSYVFTSHGWWNNGMEHTSEIWDEWRDVTRTILADPEQVEVCYAQHGTAECLESEANPGGIPGWRLLTFWYWDDPRHPLGPSFTLSPSMYNNNTLLSYSIEPTCRRIPHTPKPARPQAYLLAKQETYFYPPRFSWTIPFLGELREKLNIDMVVGMRNDNATIREELDRVGITNHGRLPKLDFYRKLGESFVLVGVGQPRISPSPWDGLCMGVPFINPILEWDEENPDDRSRWHAQQWRMAAMEPPYVYHVHAHDLPGLEAAMRDALKAPIGSFIPPQMRFEAVCGYMSAVLARNWEAEAAAIVGEGATRS